MGKRREFSNDKREEGAGTSKRKSKRTQCRGNSGIVGTFAGSRDELRCFCENAGAPRMYYWTFDWSTFPELEGTANRRMGVWSAHAKHFRDKRTADFG